MHRRTFLKHSATAIALLYSPIVFHGTADAASRNNSVALDSHIKDQLMKNRLFDSVFNDDVFLNKNRLPVLESSLDRLKRLQSTVGYANFSLLSFDDAVNISKSYSKVGPFTRQELIFLEELFYYRASSIGFMGQKPIKNLTSRIKKKTVSKIAGTGNYLYRGKPIEMYNRIKTQIGEDVILTSGVRSVMKQFYLYLNKVKKSNGNLSMASRSLAPPGYSFHGVGDFDVGKIGFGIDNFTERFTQTDVYKRLADLGYIRFRYERDNDLGVRFEPWHIEVV